MKIGIYKISLFMVLGTIIISTTLLVTGLQAVYSYLTIKEKTIEQMKKRSNLSAIALKENIADFMEAYAVNEYEKLLLTEIEYRGYFAIVIEDYNMGRILGEDAYISGKIRDQKNKTVNYDFRSREHNSALKACFYVEKFPITGTSEQKLGTISIYISDDALNEDLNQIIVSTLIDTVVISLLLIVLLYSMIRMFVLKPISDIIMILGHRDSEGLPTDPVPGKGPKEIAALSHTINNMIGSIKNGRVMLKEKEEMMIAQSRHAAMGEMISMIAHQWRQPITVIAMSANNLLADVELEELEPEGVEQSASMILEQTHHLSQTIDDFKNFFRPNKKADTVLVNDIVEENFAIIGKSLENHNIAVEKDYRSDTPVTLYSRELMQVFINIFKNAKEALVEKKIENPVISVSTWEDGERVYVSICDNGKGIDPAIISKIYDPYFSTKDEKIGTGLGLYMSKTIVQKHLNGTIHAENREEGGVCFKIALPKTGVEQG